jgi:hypothetical protein
VASRKNGTVPTYSTLLAWAESLGEALGRGVARGINSGLSSTALGALAGIATPRRRGRPPKAWLGGPVPAERRCRVDGCPREARSKGLCSAHYQAERRRQLSR